MALLPPLYISSDALVVTTLVVVTTLCCRWWLNRGVPLIVDGQYIHADKRYEFVVKPANTIESVAIVKAIRDNLSRCAVCSKPPTFRCLCQTVGYCSTLHSEQDHGYHSVACGNLMTLFHQGPPWDALQKLRLISGLRPGVPPSTDPTTTESAVGSIIAPSTSPMDETKAVEPSVELKELSSIMTFMLSGKPPVCYDIRVTPMTTVGEFLISISEECKLPVARIGIFVKMTQV